MVTGRALRPKLQPSGLVRMPCLRRTHLPPAWLARLDGVKAAKMLIVEPLASDGPQIPRSRPLDNDARRRELCQQATRQETRPTPQQDRHRRLRRPPDTRLDTERGQHTT